MIIRFRVTGQELIRQDVSKVVSDTRNYLFAAFKLIDDEWRKAETVTASFNRPDKENCCYTIVLDKGICLVPWEVLADEGLMEVSLQCGNCADGNKCITTNPVLVKINKCGEKCGLIPTTASPGIYQELVKRVDKAEEFINEMVPITIEEISELFE